MHSSANFFALGLPGPWEILFILGILFFGTVAISIALWVTRQTRSRRPPMK